MWPFQTIRIFLTVLSLLSYKLLFLSERDLSIGAVILVVICSLASSSLVSQNEHMEAWINSTSFYAGVVAEHAHAAWEAVRS